MARRQVNNVSRLERDHRYRVYSMLLDGYTYDDIRDTMAEAGVELTLHNSSLKACQESSEYAEFANACQQAAEKSRGFAMAAEIARRDGASREGMSMLAEDELMEMIRQVLPDIETAKGIRTLTGAVKDLAAIRINTKVKKAEAEAEQLRNELAAQKSHYEGQVAELKARIAEIVQAGAKKGLSEETLRKIEEKIGLL